MGLDAIILGFLMLSFKSTYSFFFTLIKRLFISFSLAAIRVVSSSYLRLLIFLPAILIPACDSSSLAFCLMHCAYRGFPSASATKNLFSMQKMQEIQTPSLGKKDPLEEGMETTPVFLPGESHGHRSLVGFSLQCHKESDTTVVTEHTHTCIHCI